LTQENSNRLTNNNFDLLRVLFALIVLLAHTYHLSGFKELLPLATTLTPARALKGFFVVSGFLIFMSYERSFSLYSYANKRIRRIYPAYFTIVIFCAIGLVLVSSKNIGDFFSTDWLRYTITNLAFLNFLEPTLPGVFEANKMVAVNGALWTVKVEVMFYLVVPIIVWFFRRFGCLSISILIYCLSVAYSYLLLLAAEQTGIQIYTVLARQLPGQMSYFMMGGLLYYYMPIFKRHCWVFVAVALVILIAHSQYPLPLFEPFAIGSIVIFFALFLYVGNFGKYGDFSYGIYGLHFPVIQLLLYSGWFQGKPYLFVITAVLISTAGSIAMWNLVEKRFLLRKSHYVRATFSGST